RRLAEGLEQSTGALPWNARAVILDSQLGAPRPSASEEVNSRIRGGARVLAGIVDKVEQHLLNRHGVSQSSERVGGVELNGNSHPGPRSVLAQPSLFAREQRAQVNSLQLPRSSAPLEPGVGEHILHQMAEAIRLAMKSLEIVRVLILGHHPLREHLGVHAKG